MELKKMFNDAVHQRAFEDWLAFRASSGFGLESGMLENIATAQQRTTFAPAWLDRGLSYTFYFTRAAWDQSMPPLERMSIIEVPTIDIIPSIDMIPDIRMIPGIEIIPG